MVDILGPSGQPLQPNSFQSQSTSPLSVNTQPAQQAMADLQKVLDSMMKSFGGSWDKVSKDSMAAQERFYRYIGDKSKEHQVALKRASNEAIRDISEVTKAKIAAFEEEARVGKITQDELRKNKLAATREASREIEAIARETDKKTSFLGRTGATIHQGVTNAAAFAGGIGGPIGSTVSAVGNLVTNPYIAIPGLIIAGIMGALEQKAAFTKVGVHLAGAGLGFGGAIRGEEFTNRLFSGMSPEAFSVSEQRKLVGVIAGSRGMAGQGDTALGIAGFQRNLGLYANIIPDAEKNTEFLTTTVKEFGSTQQDLTNTFIASRVNADRLRITQIDAIKTQIDMQKALRNITNDGTVASSVLSNITGYLNSIGASEVEKSRIGIAVAQAGSNLSLPQIAGMFAFTHGGKIPGPGELFGEGGMLGKNGTGPFQLMGQFLTKVGNQFRDPTQRMFAANQLQTQFMPGLRLQDTPKFFDIANALMSKNMTPEQAAKQFKNLEGKTPQAAAADGINKLVEILGPETRMMNEISKFSQKLFDAIQKLIDAVNGQKGASLPMSQKEVAKKANLKNNIL